MAPGPVFIHAAHCEAWTGAGFPEGLRPLPLAVEARAADSRVLGLERTGTPEARIERLLDAGEADWLQLRHAEAGCFIARIDRAA
jgi:hypothetical protein